jgi:predicted AAA+ superfamily ATPase
VLTGSSAVDLEEARKELADRRGPAADSDRILRPMSFRSFCACMQSSAPNDAPVVGPADFQPEAAGALDDLLPWLDELASLWDLFLLCGGLPRAVADQLQTGAVSRAFVNGLWDIIVGDAFKRSRTTAAQADGLLKRMVLSTGSPTNLSQAAEDMGVGSHHTAQARIDDLVAAQLVWPCHRAGDHNAPDVDAQSKIYFADPLLARLLHLRTSTMPEPDHSQLTEQQIGMELLRAVEVPAASSAEYSRLMYRRTKTKEVDFVGPAFPGQGFEGKYVDAKWRQEAQTVRSQFGRGVLATRTAYELGDDVWAVPACLLAYLLNAAEIG